MTRYVPLVSSIVESGMQVFPPQPAFRLQDCPTYIKLKGQSLKEMDVGWWDSQTERIYLVELRGKEVWDSFDSDATHASKYLLNNFERKANDVLLMLGAMWSQTEIGTELQADLPPEVHKYPKTGNIKMIFVVDTPTGRRPLLGALQTALNERLQGRVNLFGLRRVILTDPDSRNTLPITRES